MVKYLNILVWVSLLYFLVPSPSLAFLDNLSKGTCVESKKDCTYCDLFRLGNNILQFLTELALVLATIMVIWGGANIMVAGVTGGKSSMAKGRQIIKTAVIGVVITLSAWMIVGIILNLLVGSTPVWDFTKLKC